MRNRAARAVLLGCLLCLLHACGDDGGGASSSSATTTDVERIQQLFSEWNLALDDGRFEDVCAMNTQEFNEELISEFRKAVSNPTATCPLALEVMSSGSGPGKQSLRDVEVRGDTAKGSVGPHTWKFVRIGDSWKVAFAT